MLKRKIYAELVNWKKKSNGATAMMIDGARRVGKSFIAEEFARNEYKSYILKLPTPIGVGSLSLVVIRLLNIFHIRKSFSFTSLIFMCDCVL